MLTTGMIFSQDIQLKKRNHTRLPDMTPISKTLASSLWNNGKIQPIKYKYINKIQTKYKNKDSSG